MFQLLNALLLRTLPVARRRRSSSRSTCPRAICSSRAATFRATRRYRIRCASALRERQQAFATMFAWADEWFNLAPVGEVRRAPGLWVSGDYFPVLGLAPALGRLFTPADDRPGCGVPGAVVSHDFWQRELNGDPRAIGRTLRVDAMPVRRSSASRRPASTACRCGRRFDVALPFCALPAVRPGAQLADERHEVVGHGDGPPAPGWTVERADASLRVDRAGRVRRVAARGLPARPSAKAYLASTLTATPAGAGRSYLRGATRRRCGCCSR